VSRVGIGKKAAVVGTMAAAIVTTGLASPAYAAAAPSCVARWVTSGTFTQTAHMRNDCGYRVNAYIVFDFGGDGGCQTLNPGEGAYATVPKLPRRFAGINLC